MEPPTKRQRVGPAPVPARAPFDHLDDDPDADELNEQPEHVNARRDPAARLERSRAFAAFKLKSAFENIFEKYERDFTGIGDEIDLRTGEIVVNNGHIESLTTAQLTIGGGGGDEDSGADGASDAGSLNEEEQMLRGKPDVRLSRLGQNALPSISTPSHFGAPPPFFGAGTPLGIPGILHPGQMPFGGFPVQHLSPLPLPPADPTWSTPELPSSFIRHALTSGEAMSSVVRKARLSLSMAREQDGADEDDIFLSGFASSQGKENSEVPVKRKVLLARPKLEVGSAKKKGPAASASPKPSPGIAKPGERRGRPKGSLGRKRASPATPNTPNSTSAARTGVRRTSSTSKPTARSRQPGAPGGPAEEGIGGPVSTEHGSRQQQSAKLESDCGLDPENSNVYVDVSGREEKFSRKPRNQTLQIYLPGTKPPDSGSFRVISPEPDENELPSPQETTSQDVPSTSEAVSRTGPAPETGQTAPAVSAEVFSRNLVDPAYAFSDEDEPALPRKRTSKAKPPKPKSTKARSAEHEALREMSPNLDFQGANDEGQQVTDDEGQQVVDDEGQQEVDGEGQQGADDEGQQATAELPQTAGEPTITRTPAVRQRVSRKQSKRQEIPETSPYVRLTASSPLASEPPTAAAASEIPGSDPILAEAQAEGVPASLNGAPSPTLTDPTSKPEAAPPLPSPSPTKQPPPPPHTPIKKPNPKSRRKSHHPPPSPAPKHTPATNTPQRKGILSLLPFNPAGPDAYEEDELSFLTPLKPRSALDTTTAARTTPASHHVRLGLLVPDTAASSLSSTSASAKLKRAVQARAAGKATPTTHKTVSAAGNDARKEKKRKRKPGGGAPGPSTPSHARHVALAAEEDLVQTPGGTMRRCGENGFRCEREFCFRCL